MNKRLFGFILLLLLSFNSFAQSEIENFIKEGIQFHDNREYDKAIETYKKALKLDPNSTLVNYEIALSYFQKETIKKL